MSSVGVVSLSLAASLSLATGARSSNDAAVLFFDDHFLSNSSGLELKVGQAHLLTTFRDPSSYVGWGFPSVFQADDGSWRLVYQGWHLNHGVVDTKLMLMAESPDCVHWSPYDASLPTDSALSDHHPRGPHHPNSTRGTHGRSQLRCPGIHDAPNCIYNDKVELSAIFDDRLFAPKEMRLKALLSNSTISVSPDGLLWTPWAKLSSATVDPGYGVYRNPLNTSEVVVTARPQQLRRTSGRHAGYHSAGSWVGLGDELNRVALPLDDLFAVDDQMYGLPSFGYGGMVVSYFWRYHCRPKGVGHSDPFAHLATAHNTAVTESCFAGGTVASALAYSYNSRNWTGFGQPLHGHSTVTARSQHAHRAGRRARRSLTRELPSMAASVPPGTPVTRSILNNTDISEHGAYHHSYAHYGNKTAGAFACQGECDADPLCKGWTYVTGLDLGHGGDVGAHTAAVADSELSALPAVPTTPSVATAGAGAGADARPVERCCRHDAVGCPRPSAGMLSAAKTTTPCGAPTPPPPSPPGPPPPEPPLPGPHTVPMPELFPNVPGGPAANQVYPNTLVEQPERGRILVHASASTHQHGFVSAVPGTWSSLLTYQLRTDGFVYAQAAAGFAVADVLTKSVVWGGGELKVNTDATDGSVAVAITTTTSTIPSSTNARGALRGYGFPNAVAITSNSTAATATWAGGATMAALAGCPIRIAVQLHGAAKLFSLRGNFTFVQEAPGSTSTPAHCTAS